MKPGELNFHKTILKQVLNSKYFFVAHWPKLTYEIWKNYVTLQITFQRLKNDVNLIIDEVITSSNQK